MDQTWVSHPRCFWQPALGTYEKAAGRPQGIQRAGAALWWFCRGVEMRLFGVGVCVSTERAGCSHAPSTEQLQRLQLSSCCWSTHRGCCQERNDLHCLNWLQGNQIKLEY